MKRNVQFAHQVRRKDGAGARNSGRAMYQTSTGLDSHIYKLVKLLEMLRYVFILAIIDINDFVNEFLFFFFEFF